jgi:hypothetical protein
MHTARCDGKLKRAATVSDTRRLHDFLAGAVVALGGAAILAAIQEALHSRDKES